MTTYNDTVPVEQQTLSYFREGMRGYWALLGDQKRRFGLLFLVIVLVKFLDLAAPYTLKLLFDELPNLQMKEVLSKYVILCLVAFIIIQIAADAVTRFVRAPLYFEGLIALERDWPVQAHSKLLALQEDYHATRNSGKSGAIVAKACDKLAAITDRLAWGLIPSAVYMLINAVAIISMEWRLGLIFFLPMVPAILVNLRAYGKFTPGWEQWDTWKEQSNAHFYESLRNGTTVRLFAHEKRESVKFNGLRNKMSKLDVGIQYPLQWYLFFIGEIMLASYALTIVTGIYFVSKGQSEVGTIVFIIATGGVTRVGMWEMVNNYTHIMRDLVSVTRMRTLLSEHESVQQLDNIIIPDANLRGELIFNNIAFNYPNAQGATLRDFSLQIKPGTMLALVGPSGSGKSTLTKVLNRTYDVSSGTLSLDGHDVRYLDRSWYRRLFAVVLQDVQIFDTTLRENITYGAPQATDEEVADALKVSCLTETLKDNRSFPNGLKTTVGEQGVKLSGGQKQRVGIARAYLAILHGARFLVLDEATSSLDSATEREVQAMLETLRKKRPNLTIIAIAHRFSTIQSADSICVIEDGTIVECGDHAALTKTGGLYSRLAKLQELGEIA
ncbi:hypothetical protein COB52_01430 [Candidatus Kaiserbacteria bacterium]|nr:MAG: hypothetical protein COB52_01430 [Candidatus Kaiserbacteria bacterium]